MNVIFFNVWVSGFCSCVAVDNALRKKWLDCLLYIVIALTNIALAYT